MVTHWNSSFLAWSRLLYLKNWIKILLNTLTSNNDPDSQKDEKILKEIMITDEEWRLIRKLLTQFSETTDILGGSNYVTNGINVPKLFEIMKSLKSQISFDSND